MDVLSNLNRAVEYIENHICEEINLTEIEKITGESARDFSRLFRSVTGVTVNEYIRRRRLTLAVYDIQNGNEKIIDTAFKYGWESADSFRKAFVSQHGITPSQARDKAKNVNIYLPITFQINVKGNDKMNFKVIETEDIALYGVSRYFGGTSSERFEQENMMWSQDFDHIPKKICDGYDGKWYAMWNNGNYFIAREKELATKDNLEEFIIPKGKYAVFITEKGVYAGDDFPKLHDMIFNVWLPDSGYTVKDDSIVEIYHLCTDRTQRRKNRYFEVWVPIY